MEAGDETVGSPILGPLHPRLQRPKLPTPRQANHFDDDESAVYDPHGGTRLASLRRDLLAYLGTRIIKATWFRSAWFDQTIHQCDPDPWILPIALTRQIGDEKLIRLET